MSPEYIIMVVDDHTSKLPTNLNIKTFDMMSQRVFQVESLGKERKRYPMSDVIYFIHPRSVREMCRDFPEDDPIPFD